MLAQACPSGNIIRQGLLNAEKMHLARLFLPVAVINLPVGFLPF